MKLNWNLSVTIDLNQGRKCKKDDKSDQTFKFQHSILWATDTFWFVPKKHWGERHNERKTFIAVFSMWVVSSSVISVIFWPSSQFIYSGLHSCYQMPHCPQLDVAVPQNLFFSHSPVVRRDVYVAPFFQSETYQNKAQFFSSLCSPLHSVYCFPHSFW